MTMTRVVMVLSLTRTVALNDLIALRDLRDLSVKSVLSALNVKIVRLVM